MYIKHFKIKVMVFCIFQINVNTIQFNKRMRCVKVTFSSLAPLLQQKPNLVPQGFLNQHLVNQFVLERRVPIGEYNLEDLSVISFSSVTLSYDWPENLLLISRSICGGWWTSLIVDQIFRLRQKNVLRSPGVEPR